MIPSGRVPELATKAGRRAHRGAVDAALAAVFASLDRDGAVATMWDAGVPVAPVVNPRRVHENPQLDARGFFEPVAHDVAGTVRIPGFPAKWDARTEPWHTRPAPTLGEHNAEVLTELGYTSEEIAELETAQIIGTRPLV